MGDDERNEEGKATRRWRGERELQRRAGELCGGAEEVSSGAGELRRGGDEQGSSGSGAGSVLFVGGKGR